MPYAFRTEAERQLMRTRVSTGGSYAALNNVFAGSPNDWGTVLTYATQFVADPFNTGRDSAEVRSLWSGYADVSQIAVPSLPELQDPRWQGIKAGCAALAVFLFPETYSAWGTIVTEWLIRQSTMGGLADKANWPTREQGLNSEAEFLDSAFMALCMWIRHDNANYLSDAQKAIVDPYLLRQATWVMNRHQSRFGQYFTKRLTLNWEESSRRTFARIAGATPTVQRPIANVIFDFAASNQTKDAQNYKLTHVGGNRISFISTQYNNRRDNESDVYGLAGLLFENQDMIQAKRAYEMEKILFWSYADGTTAEYERCGRELDDNGGKVQVAGFGPHFYQPMSLQSYAMFADILAKNGDASMWRYTTRDGAHGSQCQTGQAAKSIFTVALRVAQNELNINPLFWKTAGIENNRINHISKTMVRTINGVVYGYESPFDYVLALINRWFKSATLKQVYTRTGMPGYGLFLATAGKKAYRWGGSPALVSAFGLQYGLTENLNVYNGLENVVWPPISTALTMTGNGVYPTGTRVVMLQAQMIDAVRYEWIDLAVQGLTLSAMNTAYLFVTHKSGVLPTGNYRYKCVAYRADNTFVEVITDITVQP